MELRRDTQDRLPRLGVNRRGRKTEELRGFSDKTGVAVGEKAGAVCCGWRICIPEWY